MTDTPFTETASIRAATFAAPRGCSLIPPISSYRMGIIMGRIAARRARSPELRSRTDSLTVALTLLHVRRAGRDWTRGSHDRFTYWYNVRVYAFEHAMSLLFPDQRFPEYAMTPLNEPERKKRSA